MTNETAQNETGTTPSRVFEQRQLTDDQIIQIENIKFAAAKLYEQVSSIPGTNETVSGECLRLTAVAKTNLEQTVLWAVKAVSRQ